ncbi:DUF305 domain-containing protein [Glycocaulis profundi]|nr:DUF305 domain-containing protein [Glycocaulis profundi]
MLAGALIAAAPAAFASPPIFQPGAPGQPSRTITAEESVEMSRSRFTEGDVRFMQHMIVHHAQAVDMVDLMDGRGEDASVRRLGERISRSQAAEMDLMRAWLVQRGQAVEDEHLHHGHHGHGGHGHHGHHGHGSSHNADPGDVAVMPGMLTPNQMAALEAASGGEFDRLFLEGMIHHHEGALDMVEELLAEPDAAEDPILSDFLSSVVVDQTSEILRMQSLLSEL